MADGPPAAFFAAFEVAWIGAGDALLAPWVGAGRRFVAPLARSPWPFLGSEAPRNYPVGLRVQSAAVGGVTLGIDAKAAVTHQDGRSVLDRGRVRTAYELGLDEVEQFVYLETGDLEGDLVMRFDVSTDLARSAAAGGFQFHGPGIIVCRDNVAQSVKSLRTLEHRLGPDPKGYPALGTTAEDFLVAYQEDDPSSSSGTRLVMTCFDLVDASRLAVSDRRHVLAPSAPSASFGYRPCLWSQSSGGHPASRALTCHIHEPAPSAPSNHAVAASGEGLRPPLDPLSLPVGPSTIPASPGSTYYWQMWHRDDLASGVATSNFTNAVAIQFE